MLYKVYGMFEDSRQGAQCQDFFPFESGFVSRLSPPRCRLRRRLVCRRCGTSCSQPSTYNLVFPFTFSTLSNAKLLFSFVTFFTCVFARLHHYKLHSSSSTSFPFQIIILANLFFLHFIFKI